MGGLGPGIGGAEYLVIAVVALLVVGPERLPLLLRKLGKLVAKARGMANEFRNSFEDMARQSELDELRKEVEALRTGGQGVQAQGDGDQLERIGSVTALGLGRGVQGIGRLKRLDEPDLDVRGEEEADEEGQDEGHHADDQTPAQLDQVLHQGRARRLDLGLVGLGPTHSSTLLARGVRGLA